LKKAHQHPSPRNSGNRARRYRSANWAALGIMSYCLALPLLLLRFHEYVPEPFGRCASLRVFGHPCPLCGVSRALACLLRGDLRGAWIMNPLAFPITGLAAVEALYRAYALAFGFREERLPTVMRWDVRAHVGLGIAYFAYSALFVLSWWV